MLWTWVRWGGGVSVVCAGVQVLFSGIVYDCEYLDQGGRGRFSGKVREFLV